MPELRQVTPLPTLVSPDLLLPKRFPGLPESMLKRFGVEAEDFNADLESFWLRVQRTLNEAFEQQVAAPQNQTAQSISDLTATFTSGDATLMAMITTEQTVRAAADGALATRATSLEASVDTPTTGLLARVSTIETTYATDSEVASSIATAISAEVTARDSAISAAVTSEATARASADTALASRATALEASVDTPTTGLLARVSTIESAYVDAAGATAISTSVVTAALAGPSGDIYAAIGVESSARVTADGAIHARWGVAIDVNNRVSGRINLDGTNQSSAFTVAVDKFVVENAAGTVTLLDIRTGGVIVFGADVQSDNFTAGSAGWRVERNSGDAEFNKVTVRNGVFITGLLPPSITPSADFTTSVSVTLGGTGGTIRYTDDGTQPIASSTAYVTPFSVSATKTIRARIFAATGEAGPESQATFTLVPAGGGGASVSTSSASNVAAVNGTMTTITSLAKTTASAAIRAPFTVNRTGFNPSALSTTVTLYRDAVALATYPVISLASSGTVSGVFEYTDTPSAGTYTYAVKCDGDTGEPPANDDFRVDAELTIIG